MLDHLTASTKRDLTSLQSVVNTNELLREVVLRSLDLVTSETTQDNILAIARGAPSKNDWRLYDHCAAVTRLYAIFESFIENLVTEYLQLLPSLYKSYEDLPQKIQTQHRLGIAQVLIKLGPDGPYKDFSEKKVLGGLNAGHRLEPYSMFIKGFLLDPQNYRAEVVNRIFGYLGFGDIWAGVEKNPDVTSFMTTRDSNETPRTVLKKLVEDRNSASHTIQASVWPVTEITAIATFLELITKALTDIILKTITLRKLAIGEAELIGTIIKKFPKANAMGIRSAGPPISIGDWVVLVSSHGASNARLLSIRQAEIAHVSLMPGIGQELGISLDRRAVSAGDLFRITTPRIQQQTTEAVEVISPDDYELPELPLENSSL